MNPFWGPHIGPGVQQCRLLTLHTSLGVKFGFSSTVFLTRRFLKTHTLFKLFRNYLSYKNGFNNSDSPFNKEALCQVWLSLPSCSREVKNVEISWTDRRTDGRTN